jgi:glycosyltransferase involved in cell wall biosynthesis
MYGGVMANAVASAGKKRALIVSLCGDDILGTAGSWPFAAIRSWVNRRASINACKAAEAIVTKSKNLTRALPSSIDGTKVHLIPNGIDLDRFRPLDREACACQLGWAPESFHVVFPLNGAPIVKRLWLAERSVARARELGLTVEFHPIQNVPHDQVPLWLNAGDVLLLTSIHEGSPNIVKEGLACNIPIVSVDVGDVAERISGLDGCYIVPPDAEAIAQKLISVASRRSRTYGREQVHNLSLPNIAERLRVVYKAACENTKMARNVLCVE